MDNYIEYNRRAYDLVAHEYAKKDLSSRQFYKDWFEMILPKYDLKKKNNVLELGAGTGQVIKKFDDFGFKTTCIEYSDEMIKYLKKNSPKSEVIKANVLDVTLKPKEYDLILALAFIHCFTQNDLIKILDKVKLWLKDDGYFAICTTIHSLNEEGYSVKKDYKNKVTRYRRKFTEKTLQDFIENQGFTIVDKFYNDKDIPKKWLSYLLKKN